MMIRSRILDSLYTMTNWLENMEENNRYYIYKDTIYYCWGTDKENLNRVRDPSSGEWFDAVQYRKVSFLTDDNTGEKFFKTYGGESYYREVGDFKKKFKKYPVSKFKGMKEIY